MCLSVSRLFWVSSLAHPNLLGTKGYVFVVVVVQGSHVTMWIVGSVYCGFSFGDCICIYMAICEYVPTSDLRAPMRASDGQR
jgi:hypothetical protein